MSSPLVIQDIFSNLARYICSNILKVSLHSNYLPYRYHMLRVDKKSLLSQQAICEGQSLGEGGSPLL